MTTERLEVQRLIRAEPAAIFRVLCDPQGHVAIDSSGMLMSAEGDLVTATGDTFVVRTQIRNGGRNVIELGTERARQTQRMHDEIEMRRRRSFLEDTVDPGKPPRKFFEALLHLQ